MKSTIFLVLVSVNFTGIFGCASSPNQNNVDLTKDCQNITVILKNDALAKHNAIQGVYNYFGLINGKAIWVQPITDKAIWYISQLPTPDWGIGNYVDAGTITRQITSSGDYTDKGPADVKRDKWWYYNMKNYEWIHGGDDIVVKCIKDLENQNQNCWTGCNQLQGKCGWCGVEGYCCKKGMKGNGCDGSIGGIVDYLCVLNPKGRFDDTIYDYEDTRV